MPRALTTAVTIAGPAPDQPAAAAPAPVRRTPGHDRAGIERRGTRGGVPAGGLRRAAQRVSRPRRRRDAGAGAARADTARGHGVRHAGGVHTVASLPEVVDDDITGIVVPRMTLRRSAQQSAGCAITRRRPRAWAQRAGHECSIASRGIAWCGQCLAIYEGTASPDQHAPAGCGVSQPCRSIDIVTSGTPPTWAAWPITRAASPPAWRRPALTCTCGVGREGSPVRSIRASWCTELPDRFGPEALRALQHGSTRDLRPGGSVQWVSHGFGRRSLNVSFCAWVWRRAWLHPTIRVEVMVHEPVPRVRPAAPAPERRGAAAPGHARHAARLGERRVAAAASFGAVLCVRPGWAGASDSDRSHSQPADADHRRRPGHAGGRAMAASLSSRTSARSTPS